VLVQSALHKIVPEHAVRRQLWTLQARTVNNLLIECISNKEDSEEAKQIQECCGMSPYSCNSFMSASSTCLTWHLSTIKEKSMEYLLNVSMKIHAKLPDYV
jgi:hypothetical protein